MTEPDPKREWWTPHEVEELYRVHISTIYRWIHIGKLPAVRFRRNLYRIRREDVEALAEKPEHPEGLKAEELDEQGHLQMGEGELDTALDEERDDMSPGGLLGGGRE